jgi:hypothetical protein
MKNEIWKDIGELIEEYPSVKEAAKSNSVHQGNIGKVAGTTGTCGGFYWKYKTERN